MASYDAYSKKSGIDITRGDIVQLQGGAGFTIARIVDVGIVGAALWQVTDDSGSALPVALSGARDQAASAGGEAALTISALRTRLVVRYEHDFRVRSRPLGQVLYASAVVKAF